MLIPRYLGLRTGEDTMLSTMGDTLLDSFQSGIADGYVISAEIAARQNSYAVSAERIMRIKPGNLPLFTEGFSLLMHRVSELIDPRSMAGAEHRPSPDTVEKLKELMRVLRRWAPYVDLNRPTLTFRGDNLTAPTESVTPMNLTAADGWIQGPDPPPAAV